jgi:hypothetical protein
MMATKVPKLQCMTNTRIYCLVFIALEQYQLFQPPIKDCVANTNRLLYDALNSWQFADRLIDNCGTETVLYASELNLVKRIPCRGI